MRAAETANHKQRKLKKNSFLSVDTNNYIRANIAGAVSIPPKTKQEKNKLPIFYYAAATPMKLQ